MICVNVVGRVCAGFPWTTLPEGPEGTTTQVRKMTTVADFRSRSALTYFFAFFAGFFAFIDFFFALAFFTIAAS
jgi:hypothetical protein